MISPPYALLANIDLLIFVLATIAALLTRRGGRWATPGYAAALLAAMLKFYPVALLILALRQRLAVFLAIGTVSFTVLAMWFVSDANAILRSAANIPTMDYHDDNVFAARDLPFGVAETLGLARPVAVLLFIGLRHYFSDFLACFLVAAGFTLIFGLMRIVNHLWALGFDALRDAGDYLLAGAVIVVPVWLVFRLLSMRGPR